MTLPSRVLSFAAAALVCAGLLPVAGLAAAPTSGRTSRMCAAGYSYDGAQSPTTAYGVSATLTLGARSIVGNGHVAAWIGVGGAGLGPGGTDEWLQVGIAHDSAGLDVLYYEYKQPGARDVTYVRLFNVSPGESHSLVVYERAAVRDSWRVIVDGQKVSDPVTLPGSHGRFQPIATAENWDGGVTGSCNTYNFDFSNLAVRTHQGGAWQPFDLSRILRDPAYSLTLRASGFTAASR